ncbi:MAG: type I glyceraldehyde-3-phosphate dehydrogenase [Pseudomonadota bacterium]|nr:MAG: type I glyceraldehyde-3-phosphate dehydrogenase [Pseudomonadota bacterium]
MRIGINGFGRIGRQVFRIAFERPGVEIAHINDVTATEVLATLLRFDTTYGRWGKRVRAEGQSLHIDGTTISVSAETDPGKLPWRDKGVDVVLESTGKFRKREDAARHLAAGAKKVLVSAPGKDGLDGDFVIGVNEDQYDRERHHVISIGSCTTNCLVPVAKVIHEEFRIQYGLINTVHAYTSSQNLVDGPNKDIRRGRAAAQNLVPTTTGAAKMIGRLIPELDGRLHGLSVRAPVSVGSLLDLTCTVEKEVTAEQVNAAFRKWAQGRMKGILEVEDEPLVSSDIIQSDKSATVTSRDTQVIGGHFLKVLAWYDNEWGFSCRCVDMMTKML